MSCFALRILNPALRSGGLYTMKLLSESIRSFFEGFVSFFTLIYKELKSW